MQKNVPVSKLMADKIVVARLDNKFSQIQELFTKFGINHLPIVFDGLLIGIISSTDIFKFYAENGKDLASLDSAYLDETVKVEDIMTRKPTTLKPDDNIRTAAKILSESNFHALPVVDDGQVVGIITNNDLVRFLDIQYDNL